MDSEESALKIIFAPSASDELDEILLWNIQRYGVSHADEYLRFLNAAINGLINHPTAGEYIPGRPGLRYLAISRKRRAHGHVAIYRMGEKSIEILHVFHTAQDWRTKLIEENP